MKEPNVKNFRETVPFITSNSLLQHRRARGVQGGCPQCYPLLLHLRLLQPGRPSLPAAGQPAADPHALGLALRLVV
jgi:hypothetical protein